MKKLVIAIIILAVTAGIVLLLMRNKSQISKKVKTVEVLKNFPVNVAPVKLMKVDEALSMIGTIYGNSEVNLVSETQGRVVAIYANVGTRLSSGSQIAKVDDELKKAAFMNAEAAYEKAKMDLQRNEQLNKEKSVSDAQLEAVRFACKASESSYIIAKRQLNDTKIISPISGVVSSRNIEVGTVVSPGTPLVTIVELATLKIKVNIAEKDVFKLKINDEVDIITDVYPEIAFKGKIKSISDRGDEAHTYPVEITLPNNSRHPLKSGMFARVQFKTVRKDESLVIPREALTGSVRNPQVYVVESGNAFIRDIVLGNDFGNFLEVTTGLKAGENIVVNGQINLRDNVPVTIIK